MHGNGLFKWPDGKVYNGEYIQDKKDIEENANENEQKDEKADE